MTKCLGFSKILSIIHSKKFPCSVALPIENNLFDCERPCKNFLIRYKGNAIMNKRGEGKRMPFLDGLRTELSVESLFDI